MPKSIDYLISIALLAAAIIGGYLSYLSGQTRAQLESEVSRIESRIGSLDPVDPNRIYILALDSPEPFEFAWRIYIPANATLTIKESVGQGSSTGTYSESTPQEFIARTKVSIVDGRLLATTSFGHRSSRLSGPSKGSLFDAVEKKSIDGFDVISAGSKSAQSIAINETFDLLRITKTTPDNTDPKVQAYEPPLYLTFNPKEP